MNDIQAIRNKLGLTQLELAGYLGISRSSVNMFERNERPLPTPVLLKLAELQMHVCKIPGFETETKSPETLPGSLLPYRQPVIPNPIMHTKFDCRLNRLHRKLTEMKRQYKSLEQVRATLEQLLQDQNGSVPVHSYLQSQLVHVLKKIRACGPEAQDMLNRKMMALTIKTGIHEQSIK